MSFLTLASLMLVLTILILLVSSDGRLTPKRRVMGVSKLGMPIYDPNFNPVAPGPERLEWGKFLTGGLFFAMAWSCFLLEGYWNSKFLRVVSGGASAVLLIVAYSIPWLAWESRYFRPRPDGIEYKPSGVHGFLAFLVFAIAVAGLVYSCSTDKEREESSPKQSMMIERPYAAGMMPGPTVYSPPKPG